MKKLALVLSGGSAKGFAHIGILKVLKENGIEPDLIVGTSMGALVGGAYASGCSIDEMINLSLEINKLGRFSLASSLFSDSLLNISKIKKVVKKAVGDKLYEDCKIPFISVANEILTGKETHFKSGKLYNGIMSSISMPGVFPRVKVNGKYYVDGGLSNNLPEDIAKEIMKDAVIVSVDVIGKYENQVESYKVKSLETIINAITILTQTIVKLKPNYSDLRIVIEQPEVSQLDFKNQTTMKAIKNGEVAAQKYVAKIKKLLKD